LEGSEGAETLLEWASVTVRGGSGWTMGSMGQSAERFVAE
jgi:hypothetical protein